MTTLADLRAAALQATARRGGLHDFVRLTWSLVSPAMPFQDSWHIGAVCAFLEAWYAREFHHGVISLPPGTGKPVHEDEQIETPNGPVALAYVRVGDYVMTHQGRSRRVLAVHEQGTLPTLELRTFAGRVVRVAPDHPMMCTRGWVAASALVAGVDVLVAVADAEDRPDAGVTSEEARWCGYMVGDGSCKYTSTVFVNADADALDDFERCTLSMGLNARRSRKNGTKALNVHVTGAGKNVQPSTVQLQLERFGLKRGCSYTKRIPPQILSGPLDTLANFLGAYWSCDGELRPPRKPVPRNEPGREGTSHKYGVTCECTTVNRDLAEDLQRAFLRLGISMRLRTRVAKLKTARQGDTYTSYRLTCDPKHIWRVAQLPGLCARKALVLSPCSIPQRWLEDPLVEVRAVEPGRCRCLTVEEDSSFVVRGLGVHNSLLVDVFADAWMWAQQPGRMKMACAYDLDLCLRDADKVQMILGSDVYRRAFPRTQLRQDKQARSDVWTTMGGYRFSTTPSGKGGLGRHFHDVSINDPVKAQDAIGNSLELGAGIERAQRWFDGTMPTRRADPAQFGDMITMQRLIEADLSGVALERGYAHLCLPMRYAPKAHWIRGDWSSKLDQRAPGGLASGQELLHPQRYPEHVVRELEASLGEHASAQLQQNPIPRTGGLIEEDYLRFEWVDLPARGLKIQVWDFSGGGTTEKHSWVHGALWVAGAHTSANELINTITDRERGAKPQRRSVAYATEAQAETRYALVDEVRGHWDIPEQERQFELAQSAPGWRDAHQIIIEAKAAGLGVLQRYARRFRVVGFHEISDETKALATKDKVDRLRPSLPEFSSGRVLLPPRERAPWVDGFRKELTSFPRGAADDRVDTTSMAIVRLTDGVSAYWSAVRQLADRGRR